MVSGVGGGAGGRPLACANGEAKVSEVTPRPQSVDRDTRPLIGYRTPMKQRPAFEGKDCERDSNGYMQSGSVHGLGMY